ncbi:mitochondrial distribution and morphology protein family 31/32 [Ceraceosorus guamensis]|uniref:Mitochondrial distribution and morphology protein family 31/32 n=1 Tax=Ceraceosorus guamensis TaxID=1522189 RepID=A0A316VT32_9BASI|nr:mitochondrial distribution and morphology protein family 31/32 [Ceraceosorus guamensis]PWN39371.1 mitochondrial distribution and morphology protein family 31/32 [Ceraceosorus guamensis]
MSQSSPNRARDHDDPPVQNHQAVERIRQHDASHVASSNTNAKEDARIPESLYENYPRSLRELATRAAAAGAAFGGYHQHSGDGGVHSESSGVQPRAPSKEELLRLARGFWTRLRIRFKWFTIRGFRRFNVDDLSAFFTLGGLGTIIFIVVGTTTAVSLVFAALNALNLQEFFARRIADYLTSHTGMTVIFESAIVPKWSTSRISFQNVFLSRRAHLGDPEALREERRARLEARAKGMGQSRTAHTAGQGMAWEGTHWTERDDEEGIGEEVAPPMREDATGGEDEGNFTQFDLNVDSIDVTLSFSRWWDGKGLVEDAVVRGVRGIVDRRNVHWDSDKPYDPRAARRTSRPGDFDLSSLVLEDLLVTVYQPGDFRPFNFSIFSAVVPRLRKQWLFYDLLGADSITGQVDGCLFSLHKPQRVGKSTEKDAESRRGRWRTLSRVRIDGVSFDHIQNQSDLHGPVSWINSGKFDVVADIKFPRDLDSDVDINAIISEIVDNLAHAVSGDPWERAPGAGDDDEPIPGQHRLSGPAIEAPVTAVGPAAEEAWRHSQREREAAQESEEMSKRKSRRARFSRRRWREKEIGSHSEDETEVEGVPSVSNELTAAAPIPPSIPPPSVVIDLDVRFRDIKAAVPLFHSALGYRTQTFVRPIVAFMNANRTLIPVHCRVVMDLSEFNGSMDLAQTGLLPVVSDKIYQALANHVTSQQANGQRLRNVSSWSLRVAAQGLLQLASTIRDSFTRAPHLTPPPEPDTTLTKTQA